MCDQFVATRRHYAPPDARGVTDTGNFASTLANVVNFFKYQKNVGVYAVSRTTQIVFIAKLISLAYLLTRRLCLQNVTL